MDQIRNIQRLNEKELQSLVSYQASWHQDYKSTNWIYISGIDAAVVEEDIIRVFSQYGTVSNVILPKESKRSHKGYAFLEYSNWKSTVLAVDNLNGFTYRHKKLLVDHAKHVSQKDEGFDVLRNRRKYLISPIPKELRETDDGDKLERLKKKVVDCESDELLADLVDQYERLLKRAVARLDDKDVKRPH